MNWLKCILTAIFFPGSVAFTECPKACTWLEWESWGQCTSTCGSAYQTRDRSACCRTENGKVINFNLCMSECHLRSADSSEKRCCNNKCFNGGSWTFSDRAQCYGRCTCTKGYDGNCCERACRPIPNCLSNEIECNFLGSNCLKCNPPYISTGWTGTCRNPICTPVCANNGSCIADNVCNCQAGYIGNRCELGGGIDAYLLPALHAVQTKPFQPLSWYDNPPFSDFGRVCYIKITIKDAPMETLLTAQSFAADGNTFGNFTTGPIDELGSLNSSIRTACLQVRCPSDANNGNNKIVEVKVFPTTVSGRCIIQTRNPNINGTVHSVMTDHDVLDMNLNSGYNYGPAYGLYVGMGNRESAIFATRQQCLSGTLFNVNDINPSNGTAVTYECSNV